MPHSRSLVDHQEIQEWVDVRGGTPACVKGTGTGGDPGIIRIDFPGFSGEDSLEPISWDQWFQAFEDNQLALLVQDETSSGDQSRFNKIIARDQSDERVH